MKKVKRIKERHNYSQRLRAIRFSLIAEILLTLLIATTVVTIDSGNLTRQAAQYVSETENDYAATIKGYVATFNTIALQLKDKIAQNPSYDEMNLWLQSMDDQYRQAIGQDVYDGISMTYKGSYAHSWNYGDYSQYDPNTRPWYQAAQAAGGAVTVVAPYVTYLDPSYLSDDEYILMTIAQKYDNEISFDYDLKILGLQQLLTGRDLPYNNTKLIMFDKKGYILSTNDKSLFAHNVYTQDGIISQSTSDAVAQLYSQPDTLRLITVDDTMYLGYLSTDSQENGLCVLYPFWVVFVQDYLAVSLAGLFLIILEIFLYGRNRRSLREFRGRDERLSAITNASYQQRLYVDMETMQFYGSPTAEKYCPNGDYADLCRLFRTRLTDEEAKPAYDEFLSPKALELAMDTMYTLESRRFSMDWMDESGKSKPSTLEVSRISSVIDGRPTVGILLRDVTEDAALLKSALKQAESASEAKGSFMSRMSHEIRTPLNAVIGYLDIAKDALTDPEKVKHCLDQSAVAARHLLSIINDVLDISSIESGRMKIANDDFDLTQLVHSLTTIFYAQAKRKSVRFEVAVGDLNEEWLKGDPLRLNQILLNLLSNAVKFTPENGEVRLDIRQLGEKNGKVHLEFKVSDTGVGMSQEYMKRMFTPFEQESAQTAQNYGGTGLGLSICHNLVKMMGGDIRVESEQGKGTAFTVALAFDKSKEQRRQHLTTESFSKLNALVVDDEESACEYAQRLLERCGVKCDTVTSGKKAVRRVQTRQEEGVPYDFCILDWQMNPMDGLETARQIRQACGSKLPIIVATSYDYSSIVDEARKAGVDKIISKPLFQSTLFDLLVNTYGKYEPIEPQKPAGTKKLDFHGMSVLVVEDNEMNMEIALDILTKAGLKPTPAVNGKEALDAFTNADEGTFDAILMDVQMPVMDGYEATKAIRQSAHPGAKTIPIIAMTANAFTSDVTAALAAGMNDHISKPISYEHLFEVLSRYCIKGDDE